MGRKQVVRKKKDKFDDLGNEYQDRIAAMSTEDIRKHVGETALAQVTLMQAKEGDQDLAEKKTAYDVANEVYKEGTKRNKLKIQFCKRVLEDRGQEVNGSVDASLRSLGSTLKGNETLTISTPQGRSVTIGAVDDDDNE